jgi:hypothetical protein
MWGAKTAAALQGEILALLSRATRCHLVSRAATALGGLAAAPALWLARQKMTQNRH